MYTAASALQLCNCSENAFTSAFEEKKSVDFAWACLSNPHFTDHLLFKTGFCCNKGWSWKAVSTVPTTLMMTPKMAPSSLSHDLWRNVQILYKIQQEMLEKSTVFLIIQYTYENRTAALCPKLCSTCVGLGRREMSRVKAKLPGVPMRDCNWAPAIYPLW